VAAHALLRMTLSRFADVAPGGWHFRTGHHGRPEIAAPASRLRFSLSHTRGLAACAVMLDRDIGFDVEDASSGERIEVAERFFSPREVRELHATPIVGRAERFLEYWTLKEAYLKARGLGLSVPLDQFSLYKEAEGAWRVAFDPALADDAARWHLHSWRLDGGYRAALAICATDHPEI